jgi:hypothetical protein
MKQKQIKISFVVLAIVFLLVSAFTTHREQKERKRNQTIVNQIYSTEYNAFLSVWFRYDGGPEFNPSSYSMLPSCYIDDYCPGQDRLCAILATPDLFYPGHPTQFSLSYLLTNFGLDYFFDCEVPGLIEFKEQ